MHLLVALSSLSTFLCAAAAWVSYASPKARAKRRAQTRALEDQRLFHADWSGVKARPGVKGQPGVMERLAAIESTLAAPILNGGGDAALRQIDRLDKRTVRFGRRLAAIERHLVEQADR